MRSKIGLLWKRRNEQERGNCGTADEKKGLYKRARIGCNCCGQTESQRKRKCEKEHENQREAVKRAQNTNHVIMHRNSDLMLIFIEGYVYRRSCTGPPLPLHPVKVRSRRLIKMRKEDCF